MRRLLFLFLLVVFPCQNVLHSAEELSTVSQLIEEQTIIVAQIDCTKVDLPTIVSEILPQKNQQLVEGVAKEIKATIAKIGLKKVYLIGNIRLPILFYFAVPKEDNVDLEAINKLLVQRGFNDQFEIRETADFKLFVPTFMTPYMLRQAGGGKRITDAAVPKSPMPRKEFAEALKAVENYPIKILVAIPDFTKRILNEIKPIIFEDDKRVDFPMLFDQFRWKAIGIDPAKSEIHAVIETQSENKTQDFLTEIIDLIDVGSEKIIEFSKSEGRRNSHSFEWIQLEPIINLVMSQRKVIVENSTPKIQGKSIVLHYSSKDISNVFEKLSTQMIVSVQDISEREKSRNNLKQITLAVHNYMDVNKFNLPPAFTVDANGKRLHSWRVLLLPYLEAGGLYKSIRLDEAWDSEYNKQFHDKMPDIYRSPTDQLGQSNRDTVYCGIIGKDTAFKEDGKQITLNNVTDGTSNTIIFVERQTPVCWMQPEDITQEDAFKGINKGGDKGVKATQGIMNTSFLDGSVRFLQEKKVNETILKAYLTISGNEIINY